MALSDSEPGSRLVRWHPNAGRVTDVLVRSVRIEGEAHRRAREVIKVATGFPVLRSLAPADLSWPGRTQTHHV